MKVIKKTADYNVYEKRSGRYAVKSTAKKPINADEKVKILLAEGLIKTPAAGKSAPKSEPEPVEEKAEEAAAEEPVEVTVAEETPDEEPAEKEPAEDSEPKAE